MRRRGILVVVIGPVLALAQAQDRDGHEHHAPESQSGSAITITINPEARLSVARGKELPAPEACGTPWEVPVEIVNQGFVTAPIEARLVGSVPSDVELDFSAEPLKGTPREQRILRLTQASPGPVDLTIAFRTRNNIGASGGQDRIHLLVRCEGDAATAKRGARGLGIPFDGETGPLNAITDVSNIEVGFTTLISGDVREPNAHPQVRTGVTAILPRGRKGFDPVFAAYFSQNGNGEMTGVHWIEESGFLDGPIMITNTHSVGVVRDAVIAWQVKHGFIPPTSSSGRSWWSMPVVAETYDGPLNDINGFHVKPEHVFASIDGARAGAVPEGNVGGGTGMRCYGFKGGTGTASRRLQTDAGAYTVGVLVQCNCGSRSQLMVRGVPVGREIPLEKLARADAGAVHDPDLEMGSIIIVVATDAPLLPSQLERLARRATMGLSRTGSSSGNYSGDIFIAFSTANAGATQKPLATITMFSNDLLSPLFEATAQATEEAILNSMVAAQTMIGMDGTRTEALPHDKLKAAMRKYNRLQ